MPLIDGSESRPVLSKKNKKANCVGTYSQVIKSTEMTKKQKKKHTKRHRSGTVSLLEDFSEIDESLVSNEHDLIKMTSERRRKKKHDKRHKSEITNFSEDFSEINESRASIEIPSEQKKKKHAKRTENCTAILSDSFSDSGENNKHSEMKNKQKKKQLVSRKRIELASKPEDLLDVDDDNAESNRHNFSKEVQKRKKKNKHTPREWNVTERLPEDFLNLDQDHDISNRRVDANNQRMEETHCRNDSNEIEIVPEIEVSTISRKKNKKRARKDIHPVENLPNAIESQNTNYISNKDETKVHASSDESRMMDSEEASNGITRGADSNEFENENQEDRLQNDSSENEDSQESDTDSEDSDSDSDTDDSDFKPTWGAGNSIKRKLHQKLTDSIDMELDDEDKRKLKELDIVIDWDLPILHQYYSLNSIKPDERKSYEDDGVHIRNGVWSYKEMVLLSKNWENFKKEYDMKNPLALLGLIRQEGTQSKYNMNSSIPIRFVRYLGRGLDDRTLLAIYQQARLFLDPKRFQGRYTKREKKVLMRLVAKYGRKWVKISQHMDRDALALHDYYKVHNKQYNRGAWSTSEDRRLISALKAEMGEKNLTKIHHDFPWTKISQLVRTRHALQCSNRWRFVVSLVTCGDYNTNKSWKTSDDMKLLKILHNSPYQTEFDIPWDSIYKQFGFTNCFQLKSRWTKLRANVPDYYIKSYPDVIDWLVKNHLPYLKRKKKQREANRTELKDKSKRTDVLDKQISTPRPA